MRGNCVKMSKYTNDHCIFLLMICHELQLSAEVVMNSKKIFDNKYEIMRKIDSGVYNTYKGLK